MTVVHVRLYWYPGKEVFIEEWEHELSLKGFEELGKLRKAKDKMRNHQMKGHRY